MSSQQSVLAACLMALGNGGRQICASLGFIAIVSVLAQRIYNLYLHPLAKFPGPFFYRTSVLPWLYHSVYGDIYEKVLDLHRQYGPVVRIAPNQLAFSDPSAWRDIYGQRRQPQMRKALEFYKLSEKTKPSLISGEGESHHARRTALLPAFSGRSIKDRESEIIHYVNLLISRLADNGDGGMKPANLRAWYNFATFDILGKLAFSSDFGCLESSEFHPWIETIFSLSQETNTIQSFRHLGMGAFTHWLTTTSFIKARNKHNNNVAIKLNKRLVSGPQSDLMQRLLDIRDEQKLSHEELIRSTSTLIVAGSETTATLLCGLTYYLLTNPQVLERLTWEVRNAFNSDSEITMTTVQSLPYLLACLEEGLRSYPPVPSSLPRRVPLGGASIAGHFVPGEAVVGVWMWAASHCEENFRLPNEFHPERFMGDPRFASDRLDVIQPFSVGPRDCIGRTLAYAEMKLILAKIIYNFDMKLAADSRKWLQDQKVYGLFWAKPDLNVFLTPVSH